MLGACGGIEGGGGSRERQVPSRTCWRAAEGEKTVEGDHDCWKLGFIGGGGADASWRRAQRQISIEDQIRTAPAIIRFCRSSMVDLTYKRGDQ